MSDLIDRLTVVNAIENTDCELPSDAWDELTDAIMSVPSAQPERNKEKLLPHKAKSRKNLWKCSECGAEMEEDNGN